MNEDNKEKNTEVKKTRGRKKVITEVEPEVIVKEEPSVEVIQPQEEIKESSTKGTIGILIFGFLIFLVMVVIMFGFVYYIHKMSNNSSNNRKDTSNIQLQYTETTDKIKEGIYITDVSEVVENVMPSIVAITSKTLVTSGNYYPFYGNQSQYAEGAGSGIIISKSDTELMILTNNHVVSGAAELSVKFINNKSVDATIKGTAKNNDVAIITVDLAELDDETLSAIKIATIGDSSKLKVGNGVIAIGNALGYGQAVTTGVVSAVDRVVTIDDASRKMIQIDAAINGGNSGGALLNSAGEVVGINSAKYSNNSLSSASIEGMGFAIPITDVKELITQLMNGETVNDSNGAVMGVTGYIVTSEMSASYGMPEGFYITEIGEGTGADKAGLEIGYIITEIDGATVKERKDISDILAVKKAGDKVKVKIKYPSGRSYKEKEVEVTLS